MTERGLMAVAYITNHIVTISQCLSLQLSFFKVLITEPCIHVFKRKGHMCKVHAHTHTFTRTHVQYMHTHTKQIKGHSSGSLLSTTKQNRSCFSSLKCDPGVAAAVHRSCTALLSLVFISLSRQRSVCLCVIIAS